MTKEKTKVVVAISGGVDSSVAAYFLREQGFEVIGLYMRLFGSQERSEMAARQVCASLGIKFYPVNISSVFKKEIINYFIDSYKNGLTPNPCVKCNKIIKFGELFKAAQGLGDRFATGHYARITEESFDNKKSIYRLFRGQDKSKDQTYFLYNLTQKELKRLIFPVGGYEKKEIKKIADSLDLPYLKKDSQDICFLYKGGKEIEHNKFLRKYIKLKPGPIKLLNASPSCKERKCQKETRSRNEIIGEHKGLPFYTIGQRKGIEIGGTGPYYAAKIDYKNNTLYVVADANDTVLYSDKFAVNNVNWVTGQEPKMPMDAKVVIRYRHKAISCEVCKVKSKKYKVVLKTPARAVTPGQSAVFYDNDEIIGGGIIG